MTALSLSSDIIHEILVSVPDLSTLFAAIRVSKSHYEAFEAHPKSIIRAVLHNLTGPAFPQAARLAEYDMHLHHPKTKIADLPDENHYCDLDWIPTSSVARSFESRQRAVDTLRDFYSQRYKERTSQTSRLAPSEVLRFDRAMYRYWLNIELLKHTYQAAWPEDSEDEEEDIEDDAHERECRAAFKAYVALLPTDELLELLNVIAFCEETERWVSRARPLYNVPNPVFTTFMSFNPHPAYLARILEADHLAESRYDPTMYMLNREIVEEVLVSRKLKQEELAGQHAAAIVKSVVGSDDACSRCDKICGVQLFGVPNVSLLAGESTICDKFRLLPGLLSRNRTECSQLQQHLLHGHNQQRIPEDVIFYALVDLAQGEDGSEGENEKEWSKDGWYCLACIEQLYKQRFMDWWRYEKAKTGAPAQDDCWYGYNCRTMTHRPAHATRLNHLCTPTRGEPPNAPPPVINIL